MQKTDRWVEPTWTDSISIDVTKQVYNLIRKNKGLHYSDLILKLSELNFTDKMIAYDILLSNQMITIDMDMNIVPSCKKCI